MKICLIHNEYGKISGEEIVVNRTIELLRENGHDVAYFRRSSAEIPEMRLGKARAFFSAIHSPSSKRAVGRLLEEKRPDIVHIHNLFPLISPSILPECKRAGIPVMMTVHNYRLVCPNGLFLRDGKICEECSGGREWRCFLRNCEANWFKSLGYALRNYIARMRRYFLDNVSIYYAQTEFQRTRLIQEGFPEDRICVIPNMVASKEVETAKDPGQYVGFVGRISPEKGIDTLIEAARACPDIQFKAAGSYNRVPDIVTKAPHNFNFRGHLDKEPLDKFYVNSRIIVLCSICYEGFPSVLLEAMLHGKPVISSRIGGLPEIVDEGVTGFLFEPGNAQDLAQKIRYLWNSPDLCRQMGRACREKVLREYSPDAYYRRLMSAYKSAIEINKHNNGDTR